MSIRLKPTADGVRVRQAPVDGTPLTMVSAQDVLEVLESPESASAKVGKSDQWIQVRTASGTVGYVNAAYVQIEGSAPAAAPAATPATPASAASTPAAAPAASLDNDTRVRRAAFAITAAFEGHGYAAYQNYDTGIVSYGRFQFTLAASSLGNVVNQYLAKSNSAAANELRANYLARINAKEEALRNDTRLKELLIAAANEPEMQDVQDEVARVGYWQPMLDLSITPRGIRLPLSLALAFDMAINHGLRHAHFGNAETALGVQPKSVVGQNGVTEEQLIAEVAKQRRDFMYRFAEKNNFPGLKVRGDLWTTLVQAGDWQLQGDANGVVNVNGRKINVRTP
jgi:hypothetical protein